MSDDNVVRLHPAVDPEDDSKLNALITLMAEEGLIAFPGDGTDQVHLTIEGLKRLLVMLIIAEDTVEAAGITFHQASWDDVVMALKETVGEEL